MVDNVVKYIFILYHGKAYKRVLQDAVVAVLDLVECVGQSVGFFFDFFSKYF